MDENHLDFRGGLGEVQDNILDHQHYKYTAFSKLCNQKTEISHYLPPQRSRLQKRSRPSVCVPVFALGSPEKYLIVPLLVLSQPRTLTSCSSVLLL